MERAAVRGPETALTVGTCGHGRGLSLPAYPHFLLGMSSVFGFRLSLIIWSFLAVNLDKNLYNVKTALAFTLCCI